MGEYTPRFEQRDNDARSFGHTRLGTGGAIQVKNDKGQVTMQKVKVQRYMAGKLPVFAQGGGDSDSDLEEPAAESSSQHLQQYSERRKEQRRERTSRFDDKGDVRREEETLKREDSSDDEAEREAIRARARLRRMQMEEVDGDPIREGEEESDATDEDEMDRRRRRIKERLLKKEAEMKKEEASREGVEEEEKEEEEEEWSSEEESEEEEEDLLPRLKPVFVRKKDRITLIEAEKEQKRLEQLETEEKRKLEDRKRESARLMEQILREEEDAAKRQKDENDQLTSVVTDDENEEMAYEEWKLREMKRLKRNRDEREAAAREKTELERVHNMTEEERRAYLRANPKVITNKADKGKYKFLQKYFHRGVFFLDEDEEVYKRNFAEATLEDRFDKTVLPKVMQVKDFGKASRTKWTHLTNEDTTDHQGAWAAATAINLNFTNKHGAGMKNIFERPAPKKKRES